MTNYTHIFECVSIASGMTIEHEVAIVTCMSEMMMHTAGAVPTINTLRNRLRAAREHAGLNQAALSARTGLSRTTIIRAESDNHSPAQSTVCLWAVACGVDSHWLLTGETTK